jgi:hypothetical protein
MAHPMNQQPVASHDVMNRLLFIGRSIDHADVRRRLRAADTKAHVACVANTPEELAIAIADKDSDFVYVRYMVNRAEVDQSHKANKRVFLAGPTSSARRADGVRGKAVLKQHALLRQPVDGRCWIQLRQPATVSPDRVRRVIIRHNVNDVRF